MRTLIGLRPLLGKKQIFEAVCVRLQPKARGLTGGPSLVRHGTGTIPNFEGWWADLRCEEKMGVGGSPSVLTFVCQSLNTQVGSLTV